MTLPRRSQVSLAETPYYHCVARCVRRAFLCGNDVYSGRNFEHRRQWLLDRLRLQADVFSIDICAYAIMSNHYHLVLRVDQATANALPDEEVVARWTRLFKGPVLIQRMQAGDNLSQAQRQTVAEIIGVWRKRLSDISWYMRCLNEYIARRANAEDECTGRFWEGRFKSQALLDDTAVLSCMAYVDLNPVRAGMAGSLEASDFTSIQARLRAAPRNRNKSALRGVPLLPLSGRPEDDCRSALPFGMEDYLDLVAATGRCQARGKRGVLATSDCGILERLGLSPDQWKVLIENGHSKSLKAIGSLSKVRAFSLATRRKRAVGASFLKLVYSR